MSKKLEDLLKEVASHLDQNNYSANLAQLREFCDQNRTPFAYTMQPLKFMEELSIKTPQGMEKFIPWTAQRLMVEHIEQNGSVVLNVARQMGSSTMLMAYACYFALAYPKQPVYLFPATARMAQRDMLKRYELRWPELLSLDNFHDDGSISTLTDRLIGVSDALIIVENFDCIPYRLQKSIGKFILDNHEREDYSNKWILQGQPNRSTNDNSDNQFWDNCVKGIYAPNGLVPLTLNGYSRPMKYERDRFTALSSDQYFREIMVIPET